MNRLAVIAGTPQHWIVDLLVVRLLDTRAVNGTRAANGFQQRAAGMPSGIVHYPGGAAALQVESIQL